MKIYYILLCMILLHIRNVVDTQVNKNNFNDVANFKNTKQIFNEESLPNKTLKTETGKNFNKIYPCGQPVILSPRIVGGEQARLGKWPWQALLLEIKSSGTSFICGGTLISRRWVVTAAHCVKSSSPQSYLVGLGVLNRKAQESTAVRYSVSRIVNHQGFNNRTYENDICLLELSVEVQYNDYIIPACLPNQDENVGVGKNCLITGWGKTKVISEPSIILQEAVVPVISNSVCASWYSRIFSNIYDVQFCAGFEIGRVDACLGDSGGPLVCQDSSSSPFILQGVTSFGYGCGDPGYPGVYTRVSSYVDWIQSYLSQSSEKDSFYEISEKPCGEIITSNDLFRLPVNIATQLYDSEQKCMWTLQPNHGSCSTVTISFVQRFMVEAGSGSVCFDSVRIMTTEVSNPDVVLCGTTLPKNIVLNVNSEEEVVVLFTSDKSLEYEGFAMNVTFQNDPFSACPTPAATASASSSIIISCGGTISENQTFSLPVNSNTRLYDNNMICRWTLVPNGRSTRMHFVGDFDIEGYQQYCYDYIIIYASGSTINSPMCGFSPPSDLTVPANNEKIEVLFESDLTVGRQGFTIDVEFTNCATITSLGSVYFVTFLLHFLFHKFS